MKAFEYIQNVTTLAADPHGCIGQFARRMEQADALAASSQAFALINNANLLAARSVATTHLPSWAALASKGPDIE